jgi:hypothetical protein
MSVSITVPQCRRAALTARIASQRSAPHKLAQTEELVVASLSISRAWDETREVLRKDGRLLAAVALAMFVLPGLVSDIFTPKVPAGQLPDPGAWMLFGLIAVLLTLVGLLAIVRLALGPAITVGGAISEGVRRAPTYVAASLIWSLPLLLLLTLMVAPYQDAPQEAPPAVGLALLAMMAAYVFLSIRLLLITPVSVGERLGPVATLKRSWALSRGHWWKLFATMILLIIAFGVILLALGAVVGSLVTLAFGEPEPFSVGALLIFLISQITVAVLLVLIATMLARIYAQLAAGAGGAHASVPDAP